MIVMFLLYMREQVCYEMFPSYIDHGLYQYIIRMGFYEKELFIYQRSCLALNGFAAGSAGIEDFGSFLASTHPPINIQSKVLTNLSLAGIKKTFWETSGTLISKNRNYFLRTGLLDTTTGDEKGGNSSFDNSNLESIHQSSDKLTFGGTRTRGIGSLRPQMFNSIDRGDRNNPVKATGKFDNSLSSTRFGFTRSPSVGILSVSS
jgi:hypothetical protein